MGLIPWRNKGSDEGRQTEFLPSIREFRQEMDQLFDRFLKSLGRCSILRLRPGLDHRGFHRLM